MEKVTLSDMYKLSKAAAKPLLFDETIVDTFPYLREYIVNFADFDRQIARTMGLQYPILNLESLSDAQEVWDEFRADCQSVVRRYNFNLSKLFKLIAIDYEPLENYKRHEETSDESSGSSLDINNYGAEKNTENLGKVDVTQNVGELNSTNTNGARNTTVSYGATKQEDEKKITGDNSDDYAMSDKNIVSAEAHNDSTKIDSVVDTSKVEAQTNVTSQEAVTNIRSKDEHEDVLDSSHKETAKRVSDINGNIGVMSSQQMFEQEWNIIKNYNPYNVLLKLISNDLLVLFSEGYSAMNTTLQNELLML